MAVPSQTEPGRIWKEKAIAEPGESEHVQSRTEEVMGGAQRMCLWQIPAFMQASILECPGLITGYSIPGPRTEKGKRNSRKVSRCFVNGCRNLNKKFCIC